MKKIIIGLWVALATIVLGAAVVYATATQSGNFPTTLNNFQDGNVINAGDWNAIESTIGVTNSAVPSSLDYLVRHGSVDRGGTGLTSGPSAVGQLLGGFSSGTYGLLNLIAGSNITITTTTPGQITISSTGGGGSGGGYTTVCSSGCDYTTTGSNDHVPINAAISAVNALGGGTVLIKKGSYNIPHSISMLSNVDLVGEGAGTLLNVSLNAGTDANNPGGIGFSSTTNASIRNLRLDGSSQSITAFNANMLVHVNNSKNIRINNNTFTNCNGFCVVMNSGWDSVSGTTSAISIMDNYMQGNAHQDLIGGTTYGSTGLSTTTMVNVIGNILIQKTFAGGVTDSNMDTNCMDLVRTFQVNFSENNCRGSVIFGEESYPNQFSKISNNIIDKPDGPVNVSGEIVMLQRSNGTSATNTPMNLFITGNLIKSGKITVRGTVNNYFEHLTITNNSITTAPDGYQSKDSIAQIGIFLEYTRNSLVADNDLQSGTVCGTGGTGSVGIASGSGTASTTYDSNLVKGFLYGMNIGSTNVAHENILIENCNLSQGPSGVLTSHYGVDFAGHFMFGTTTATSRFTVASTTGVSLFSIAGNGSTTIPSLGTGVVCATSGLLYSGCASAGGGWTANGNFLFNSSGYKVGVNTTTPSANLFVMGTSTDPSIAIFQVASTSLQSVFTISQAGNVSIQPTANSTSTLQILNSAGGTVLSVDTTAPAASDALLTVASSTGASVFSVNGLGLVSVMHLAGLNTTTPTSATSTGIGAAAGTVSVSGTDLAGYVTLNTSNAPAANATVVTLTFNKTYDTAPFCVQSSATSSLPSAFNIWSTTTASSLIIKSGTTALTGTSTYAFYYHCIQ